MYKYLPRTIERFKQLERMLRADGTHYREVFGEEPMNTNYRDRFGVLHIKVSQDWRVYDLNNGEWVERAPF